MCHFISFMVKLAMDKDLQGRTPYKYCLNCQTELQGKYCHVCGQQATNIKPTIREFIYEYLNIAFIWDRYFFKTLSLLVRKPGVLTNEYISGKFVSYTHPLKLNMFLLFVFISFFLLFHSNEDMGNSVQNLTRDEYYYPTFQLQYITDNHEYFDLVKSSHLDTVQLCAPVYLPAAFPELITNVGSEYSVIGDSAAVWTAAVPHQLIEDEYIIPDAEGYFHFNTKHSSNFHSVEIMEKVWGQMVNLFTKYFLVIILLTTPLLSFIVRLIQRKGKQLQFKHFVFSLHYTAFLELIIILIYILHLAVSPPMWIMQCIILSGAFIYLTIAMKKVYAAKRWIGAIGQALLTNIGYSMILMMLFVCIFLIACIIVAIQM